MVSRCDLKNVMSQRLDFHFIHFFIFVTIIISCFIRLCGDSHNGQQFLFCGKKNSWLVIWRMFLILIGNIYSVVYCIFIFLLLGIIVSHLRRFLDFPSSLEFALIWSSWNHYEVPNFTRFKITVKLDDFSDRNRGSLSEVTGQKNILSKSRKIKCNKSLKKKNSWSFKKCYSNFRVWRL